MPSFFSFQNLFFKKTRAWSSVAANTTAGFALCALVPISDYQRKDRILLSIVHFASVFSVLADKIRTNKVYNKRYNKMFNVKLNLLCAHTKQMSIVEQHFVGNSGSSNVLGTFSYKDGSPDTSFKIARTMLSLVDKKM